MGLLDKAKALANEVVHDGRKGADAVADELRKARGIISGNADGFVRPGSPYAERLLTDAEKDLARQVFEETLPFGAIFLSSGGAFSASSGAAHGPRA